MRARIAITAAAIVSLFASEAAAHPIVVDGMTSDWLGTAPTGFNVGRVQRDVSSQGEFYWTDETGDERTDLTGGSANPQADLRTVQVTADPLAMHLLITAGTSSTVMPLQIQVAIDLDLVPMSGQAFLGGFADTRVEPSAFWEVLLQSQLTAGGVRVDALDTSFTRTMGVGTVAIGPGVFEVTVPWTALGLMGPPPQMQISVATFHEDSMGNTVDIGGPTIPNALDVLTDYADQPNQTFNTFEEFTPAGADDTIDHAARIWLDATGEVYAPLLVSRFVSDAAGADGGEWIELSNASPAPLDLAPFKVGDEESPGGGEGMRQLAAGMLAPGASILLAGSAADFMTYYGSPADGDLGMLSAFSGWASGSVALANGGDQILVLGPDNCVLDVVSYGTASYPGTNPLTPDPPNLDVAVRTPPTADTDDNAADFVVTDACRTVADCTGAAACNACNAFSCEPGPPGTSCADADVCNGDETCDGTGFCAAGTPLSCDDANPCTADSCDATAGCMNTTVADGTACADADVCNGDETCVGGACTAGTPLSCDDANPCTADACDATAGCMNVNVADGTACADADLCNGDETCVAGACTAGTPLVCDDANPCTTDSCDATAGCQAANVADGTSCDDADVCNGDEVCMTGSCTAGAALDCDDMDDCTTDSCDPSAGCQNTMIAGCMPDAGAPDGGATGDAGPMGATDAGPMGATDGGGAMDGGGAADAGPEVMDGGCSCRVGRTSERGGPLPLLGLLALVWLRRRRRGPHGTLAT